MPGIKRLSLFSRFCNTSRVVMASPSLGCREYPHARQWMANPPVRHGRRTLPAMGRRTFITTFGLAAICDACWRSCITMDQEGGRCFHCGQGVFVHRRFWVQTLCNACNGTGCSSCEKGLMIFPSEDPDVLAGLPAYRASLAARKVPVSSVRA